MNLSTDRVTQLTEVANKWVSGFNKEVTTDEEKEDFLSVFHPSVKWVDHAFQIQREGHEALLGLHKAFRHCNQPFTGELKDLEVTASGATTEIIWRGRHTNDIVRPNGEVAVKATGKEFVTHVCILIKVNEQGKITKLDEHYNKHWEDGRAETEYMVVKGASLKSD